MGRRRLWISVGLILGFVAAVLIGMVAMLKREPNWYVHADLPDGEERKDLSHQALAEYSKVSQVLSDPNWEVSFTTNQLNAFFQEDYFRMGGDENLPDGFHAPRVKIENERMRIGARYGSGLTSTIVTLELKFWKVSGQLNTVAMEIVSLQAGSLPLSTGNLLDVISQGARRQNISITWYRHNGHPVAVMRFQADQARPTFEIDDVEFRDGALVITGRSAERWAAPPPRVLPKS